MVQIFLHLRTPGNLWYRKDELCDIIMYLLVVPCENKHIEDDSGGKANILGSGSIGHCEKKKFL
jgi:hypothetical protein